MVRGMGGFRGWFHYLGVVSPTYRHANCYAMLAAPIFSYLFMGVFQVGCGDGSVRLHAVRQEQPVAEWSSGDGVVSVQWSPTRPAVFCVLDAASNLHIWDLLESSTQPVITEKLGSDRYKTNVTRFSFLDRSCSRGVHLLRSSQGDGHGSVWRLGATELVRGGGAGAPVRNNRTAVFHSSSYHTQSCRNGEVGDYDKRSPLNRLRCSLIGAPWWAGPKSTQQRSRLRHL